MYTLVLLSGGKGARMQNAIPKQYMLLAGKPVMLHILERIEEIKEIKEVVIVCANEYVSFIQMMLKQYNININVRFAEAGETRQASVKSGLLLVNTDKVIIHEAARPFVSVSDFGHLIREENENAIMGIKIPFTVIKGNQYVNGLLNRSELINVQLPQKFDVKTLLETHEKAEKEGRIFTEDASMLYFYKPDVKIEIIEGAEYNIKLTSPIDLLFAELIYKEYFARRK